MLTEEKLRLLSTYLIPDYFTVVEKFVNCQKYNRRLLILHLLDAYQGLLGPPIKNNDSAALTKAFVHIRSHLCQIHTKSVAHQKLTLLYSLTKRLIDKGVFTEYFIFPDKPYSDSAHKAYKAQIIPNKYLVKIKSKKINADEEFYETLSRTCSLEISQRLREHVYNFKQIKQHRGPLNNYLNFVFAEDPRWYEHPKVIEGTLLKFRNNLLKKVSRNTAYRKFQNVKNAIAVLRDHNLISKETDFPDNLRRCVKTQQVRLNNPLLCTTDIYDEREKDLFRNTSDFIKELTSELANNLNLLLEEARKIVLDGYQKFKEQSQIISNSQKTEFLKHPDLRIIKKYNPFSSACSSKTLRKNNLVAYFDHFYECFINGMPKHDLEGISYSKEVQQHLGLTTRVASAMQTIIIEELGINPYSLYNVKVYSDGHGHEFIQVTDEGSVKLRALKLRARHTKTRNTIRSFVDPIDISEQDIDAATCLKMALEMTNRAREFTNQKELWLCTSKYGISNPIPSTFQNQFKKIRAKAAKKSELLKYATLTKVRSSKGVWIYLDSNGDSLKAANYFGNTVKTTLARYIPDYLTELVYRVKIRSFQHVLLFMAVTHDESPADSLQLTIADFRTQVIKAFDNPDMGGTLYESLKSQGSEHDTSNNKYFCISLKNIILALKYVKNGEDQDLKDDCIAAISKISEGPIILKLLLRQAEKKLNSIEDS
ncbi:hypothetical protein [Photobacterium aquimaris]|uniref:Uncharacterized protein n=1 Tax=Photobacterium aquimaris TaxID=512643 RepID=A0A2T3HU01_9GAMM|nr:hypothetical protein [Photobacterium aquimaris]OBU24344.1 hypothetical protein AYY21_02210 [Photobacterium aquimaris]PQJ40467.1 hypothetical protein BTN98_01975 [Photobacterium aquimaris]PST99340.1 hypothetical protein C0W81_17250 [Photobacterium aquimaris]